MASSYITVGKIFPKVICNIVMGYCAMEWWMPCSKRFNRNRERVKCAYDERWDWTVFSFYGKFDRNYCVTCFLNVYSESLWTLQEVREYVKHLPNFYGKKQSAIESFRKVFAKKTFICKRGHLVQAKLAKAYFQNFLLQ